jgi:hypothetical protein
MMKAWASREFWPTGTDIIFGRFTTVYHVTEKVTETDEDHSQIDSCLSILFY